MTKTNKKQVATKEEAQLPSTDVMDFEAAAESTANNMDKDDIQIPRLNIIQALSPQRSKNKPEYIEGATEGHILNTVSQELVDGDTGIVILPVSYRRTFIEWKNRDAAGGGGFIKDHGKLLSAEDEKRFVKNKKGQLVDDEAETHLVTTAEYFAFVVDIETGSYSPVVLSMAGSQLKVARRLNAMITQLQIAKKDGSGTFNPPMFYRAYRFKTVPMSNDQGDWFGWSVAPEATVVDLKNGGDIANAAYSFFKQIDAGEVTASAETEAQGTPATESDDDPM